MERTTENRVALRKCRGNKRRTVNDVTLKEKLVRVHIIGQGIAVTTLYMYDLNKVNLNHFSLNQCHCDTPPILYVAITQFNVPLKIN
jgi:hypothetical protein